MSHSKQQRLKRLVDLRAKEVDRRVKELTLARTRETAVCQSSFCVFVFVLSASISAWVKKTRG